MIELDIYKNETQVFVIPFLESTSWWRLPGSVRFCLYKQLNWTLMHTMIQVLMEKLFL